MTAHTILTPAQALILKGYARRLREGMSHDDALEDLAQSTGLDFDWLAFFIDEGPYELDEYE